MEYIGTIDEDIMLNEVSKIVIFGVGKIGKNNLDCLRKRGLGSKVVCFCDNNKAGSTVEGMIVNSVEFACSNYKNATFLVSSMYVRQMVEELKKYGIEHIHITRKNE